jgi:hypothetical protein
MKNKTFSGGGETNKLLSIKNVKREQSKCSTYILMKISKSHTVATLH